MSTSQFITIRAPHSNRQVDLEVPADEPIQSFLPDLIKVINWPEMLEGDSVNYHFTNESGQLLDSAKSISALGVENFEMLWLNMESGGTQAELASQEGEHQEEESDRRALPLPPVWARIPIDTPSLVSERGVVFVLGEPPITIGRASRKFKPDIDLLDWDTDLLCSRRHAEISKKGKSFVLHAFATTNGTFINGNELAPEKKKALKDGDQIQFGFRGFELIFRIPD